MLSRRSFFRRTLGALATAAIAPQLPVASAPLLGFSVIDVAWEDTAGVSATHAQWLGRAAALQQEQLAASVFTSGQLWIAGDLDDAQCRLFTA